jgi:hypothetical protein
VLYPRACFEPGRYRPTIGLHNRMSEFLRIFARKTSKLHSYRHKTSKLHINRHKTSKLHSNRHKTSKLHTGGGDLSLWTRFASLCRSLASFSCWARRGAGPDEPVMRLGWRVNRRCRREKACCQLRCGGTATEGFRGIRGRGSGTVLIRGMSDINTWPSAGIRGGVGANLVPWRAGRVCRTALHSPAWTRKPPPRPVETPV